MPSICLALGAFAFLIAPLLCGATPAVRASTAAGTGSKGGSSKSDRVYLRAITALSFSDTSRAYSRSGARYPQLKCVGGSASGFWWFFDYYPHQVQCVNIGWDGSSIQWNCEASLREFVEFGSDTDVVCDPYDDDPKDGYVFSGSCRLLYTLNFTDFRLSSVHIIYGCLLVILLLYCYYQSRYLIHGFFKRRKMRLEEEQAEREARERNE